MSDGVPRRPSTSPLLEQCAGWCSCCTISRSSNYSAIDHREQRLVEAHEPDESGWTAFGGVDRPRSWTYLVVPLKLLTSRESTEMARSCHAASRRTRYDGHASMISAIICYYTDQQIMVSAYAATAQSGVQSRQFEPLESPLACIQLKDQLAADDLRNEAQV